MLKLSPTCKDYIWGGTRLHTLYGKPMEGDRLAESWEVSAHPDGPSIIASGPMKGKSFSEYWSENHTEKFPVLIKLIDSAEALSVQVHPDDEYAHHQGDLGKNEMWFILDAKPGAYLYYGFRQEISREEFLRRVEDNTLLGVLNKVEVAPGDVFFIPAGTIHAIGAGILLAEVQQSSNLTYRVYDYGRGRELHLKDAEAVTILAPVSVPPAGQKGDNPRLLAQCDYFTAAELTVTGEGRITLPEGSFGALLILEGEPTLCCDGEALPCRAAESVFLPEGSPVCQVTGDCRILITTK